LSKPTLISDARPPAKGDRLRWTSPSALATLIASWDLKKPLWVDAPSEQEAEILAQDLQQTLGPIGIYFFPSLIDYVAGEISPPGIILQSRLKCLAALMNHKVKILITGPMGSREKIPHLDWFLMRQVHISSKSSINRDYLFEKLIGLGYCRTPLIAQPGDFSSRGLVLDIWPHQEDQPIRIELNGDDIESMNYFDVLSQRRTPLEINTLTLFPKYEGDRSVEAMLNALKHCAKNTIDPSDDLAYRINKLKLHGHYSGEELFYPLLGHPITSLNGWLVGFDRLKLESRWCSTIAESFKNEIELALIQRRQGGVICPNYDDRFFPIDPSEPMWILTEWKVEASVDFGYESIRDHKGDIQSLVHTSEDFLNRGYRVLWCGATEGTTRRFQDLIEDYRENFSEGMPQAVQCDLSGGFILHAYQCVFITEWEAFGRKKIYLPSQRSRTHAFLSDLSDLKVGDPVVHLDHGIGEFIGFVTIEAGGENHDVVRLRYADGAYLDVSLERADLLQRYSSAEGAQPRFDKLGSTHWAKVKRRSKKAIRDLSEELLKLYAKRQQQVGYAFPVDGPEMAEFELSFPFEPTRDQIESWETIKSDLESSKPMDRLLVGDVGFGKTEVAMRAAAKVVFGGKQVAFLCPTTVLCFQHYRNLKERFAAFPIRIEMMNRFVEKSKMNQIRDDLEKGTVDILIGTHQVLGKGIQFAELGLVIIDEEQRFGVSHKEKLKKLRVNVDQLSMSATPIPRSLHMSLTGLREISLIETPPKNRLAIETIVTPWSDEMIQSAIHFELKRKGQVFFVHNRVESIESIAARIQELVPEAKMGIGHGQLPEQDLEKVMLDFMEGRVNVLVSTTIIENGLDIPNANTLIVHRADLFGLSQLYQLRGRVGRSDVPAFAYLMIPSQSEITDDARKRLQALEDFSELGSGFRIAALDLELRGAGNILGAEQSGHIGAIGYELYMKMLEESIQDLQGHLPAINDVHIELGKSQIAPKWIDHSADRLVIYKRISRLKELADLETYREELEDRFGAISPDDKDTLEFFEKTKLKLWAQKLGIHQIITKRNDVFIKISPSAPIDIPKIIEMTTRIAGTQFHLDGSISMPSKSSMSETITMLIGLLKSWKKTQKDSKSND
jgi:transcription-repair coupling factor (superfamily II helicase)